MQIYDLRHPIRDHRGVRRVRVVMRTLCCLVATTPAWLSAQSGPKVAVTLDSILGANGEVPAAKAELGLRAGLADEHRLQLLPLGEHGGSGRTAADYHVAAVLRIRDSIRVLTVHTIDERSGRVVAADSTRARASELSDSAAALGRRTALAIIPRTAVTPTWRPLERTTVRWRAGAVPYELALEERVPARDADPIHRILIRVPKRPDFTLVDDRGPGVYVPVREALRTTAPQLIRRTLPDSGRVLVMPRKGPTGSALLAVFGWAYASTPNDLTLIGFDATGYPRLVFHREFALTDVADLDGDGVPELVGRLSIPQALGRCSATYDPFAVYRLVPYATHYDENLSRRYNVAHYVWAGPRASEHIRVDGCTAGAYHIHSR